MKRILTTLSQKWPEYLLEVLVLIIGIYGAFALDSWNEDRKQSQVKETYLNSLIEDLTKDSLLLSDNLSINRGFQKRNDSIKKLIAVNKQPISTIVKQIARSEYGFGLRVLVNFNNNTFNLLISSGAINLFSDQFVSDLMELNRLQLYEQEIAKGNQGFYFDMVQAYIQNLPSGGLSSFVSESSLNQIWNQVDEEKLTVPYLNLLNFEDFALERQILLKTEIAERTNDLIISSKKEKQTIN